VVMSLTEKIPNCISSSKRMTCHVHPLQGA
jgi:hypothetical protein